MPATLPQISRNHIFRVRTKVLFSADMFNHFVPGEIISFLGQRKLYPDHSDKMAPFYEVESDERLSKTLEVPEGRIAMNPLEFQYINAGVLEDERVRDFYKQGAGVLVHTLPHGEGLKREECFLDGKISGRVRYPHHSIVPVGYRLSLPNQSIEILFNGTPRLFRVSLTDGGDVYQFENRMCPSPWSEEGMKFYRETFPNLR